MSAIETIPLRQLDVTPFPNTWYFMGLMSDYKQGQVYSKKFCGREIVLTKVSDTKVTVFDAYCPHLGAHLGRTINNKTKKKLNEFNEIRCVYHGFRYNEQGEYVGCDHGDVTQKPKLNAYEVDIKHSQLIMVYFHKDNKKADWKMPDIYDDSKNFSKIICPRTLEATIHPLDSVENAIDRLHFKILHRMNTVEAITKPEILHGGKVFKLVTKLGDIDYLPDWMPGKNITGTIEKYSYGVGLAMAHIYFDKLPGFSMRHAVAITPIDENVSTFKFIFCTQHYDKLSQMMSKCFIPQKHIDKFYDGMVWLMSAPENVVNAEDIDVWSHKIIVDKPVMNSNDGPIHAYRKFTQQFL
ncbi:MAG: Rieske 2Fe-2S domain-containing protein [Pseudomonadales bacterium]|nr:Rieske 2Fe-2S domain-containing protein [Pseudomonadales bacterium]